MSNDDDLKPRGEKRQWWLCPLDALAYSFDLYPGPGPCIYPPASVPEALADYQNEPGPETAAACFRAFLDTLGEVPRGLDLVVQVLEYGAQKYAPDNWRHAAGDFESFRREYLSAMCRHAYHSGGPVDPDSGLPHAAHGACTALMILSHELNNT